MASFGITPQGLPRSSPAPGKLARAAQQRADNLAWRLFTHDVSPAVRAGAAAALAVGSAQAALLPNGLATTFAAAAALRGLSLTPSVAPHAVQVLPLSASLSAPVPAPLPAPLSAALLPPRAAAAAGPPASSPAEQQVLQLVNAERAGNGLAPLSLDPRLTLAATAHSQHMASVGKMEHEGIGDGTPRERLRAAGVPQGQYAENVATGQTSAEQVLRDWMKSPGHRRNILDPELTTLGVGVVPGPTGELFWTQNFA